MPQWLIFMQQSLKLYINELQVSNGHINLQKTCIFVNFVEFMMAYIILRTYVSVNVVILNTNIYHNISMCEILVNVILLIVYVH